MLIGAIDVGVKNIGLAIALVDGDNNPTKEPSVESKEESKRSGKTNPLCKDNPWRIIRFTYLQRIDLTCIKCDRNNCTLYHSKELSDYVDHFYMAYSAILQNVDLFLIERQPPEGMKHVEQLLFKTFRHQAVLVSPRTLHCFLHIQHLDYDKRNDNMTKRTIELFQSLKDESSTNLLNQFKDRAHDIAVAAMYIYWYVYQARKKHSQSQFLGERAKRIQRIIEKPKKELYIFRFDPNKKKNELNQKEELNSTKKEDTTKKKELTKEPNEIAGTKRKCSEFFVVKSKKKFIGYPSEDVFSTITQGAPR